MSEVYLLIECDVESCHTCAVYSNKRSCFKGMLELKRDRVQKHLNDRLLYGKKLLGGYCSYRNIWIDSWLNVVKFEILE